MTQHWENSAQRENFHEDSGPQKVMTKYPGEAQTAKISWCRNLDTKHKLGLEKPAEITHAWNIRKEKNHFKAQYKILKSSRAHKTDCYFPLPWFYSTGFLTSQILLSVVDYCFSWILYSFTLSGQNPEDKTEQHNPVIYLIRRHSTHKYFAFLKSYRGVARSLTRAVGFEENFPKAKLTPATSASLRFCVPKFASSFIHCSETPNSQETLRDPCDSFQKAACNSTSRNPGNPEQPQSSWLSAQRETRLPGGVEETLTSHQEQEIFL